MTNYSKKTEFSVSNLHLLGMILKIFAKTYQTYSSRTEAHKIINTLSSIREIFCKYILTAVRQKERLDIFHQAMLWVAVQSKN